MANKHKRESGQATVEYILIVSAVVSFYVMLARGLNSSGLASKLAAPITTDFARAYQYGRIDAKGYDDGGPINHPRAVEKGNNNFRIFINPTPGG